MACTSLRAVPEYGNREVVVIYSSLSTCDPGDIHETIAKLKKHKVRASVVGLGAEMVRGDMKRPGMGWDGTEEMTSDEILKDESKDEMQAEQAEQAEQAQQPKHRWQSGRSC